MLLADTLHQLEHSHIGLKLDAEVDKLGAQLVIFGPVRCTAVLLHPVVNLYGCPCHGKAAHFSHHIVEDLNDAFCIGQ